MPRKKQELTQISFEDCFEDYVEDKKYDEEDDKPKKKVPWAESTLGQILDSIRFKKNEELLDDPELLRQFDSFRIIRHLSMTE